MQEPRIAPVDVSPEDPQLREELARWMPPGAGVAPLLLFRTLARHPALMQAMRPLGAYILGRRFALSLRLRELLIDRVCARCGCEYEWGVHVTGFGAAAGIDAATAEATVCAPADAPCFDPAESALLRRGRRAVRGARARATPPGKRSAATSTTRSASRSSWRRLVPADRHALQRPALPLEPWAARFPRGAADALTARAARPRGGGCPRRCRARRARRSRARSRRAAAAACSRDARGRCRRRAPRSARRSSDSREAGRSVTQSRPCSPARRALELRRRRRGGARTAWCSASRRAALRTRARRTWRSRWPPSMKSASASCSSGRAARVGVGLGQRGRRAASGSGTTSQPIRSDGNSSFEAVPT